MTGIFYGSTTGNTESLAMQIASKMGIDAGDIYDVAKTTADKTAGYDLLLLGSSTWGFGELQDDWDSFINKLKKESLEGKRVAFFGCGDSSSYPDTFCDAMAIIREALENSGCTFVGETDAAGYPETSSKAFRDGRVIGLAADDDEPGKTAERMDAWMNSIRK